jgi:hypothetical protein
VDPRRQSQSTFLCLDQTDAIRRSQFAIDEALPYLAFSPAEEQLPGGVRPVHEEQAVHGLPLPA